MLRRAHLYWGRAPAEKRRPWLILSPDERNEFANDVLVVPVSTVLHEGLWHVRLYKGEGGLPRPSVAKCEQITTAPKERFEEPSLGIMLSPSRMHEVERALLRALGIPDVEPQQPSFVNEGPPPFLYGAGRRPQRAVAGGRRRRR